MFVRCCETGQTSSWQNICRYYAKRLYCAIVRPWYMNTVLSFIVVIRVTTRLSVYFHNHVVFYIWERTHFHVIRPNQRCFLHVPNFTIRTIYIYIYIYIFMLTYHATTLLSVFRFHFAQVGSHKLHNSLCIHCESKSKYFNLKHFAKLDIFISTLTILIMPYY